MRRPAIYSVMGDAPQPVTVLDQRGDVEHWDGGGEYLCDFGSRRAWRSAAWVTVYDSEAERDAALLEHKRAAKRAERYL